MDSLQLYTLTLVFILSLLSSHLQVIHGASAVVFLDSPTRQYLRGPSSQTSSLSPFEIGATASILLGFAPPSALSEASSAKLNEVLMPNPFDKPRALLILEVTGAEETQHFADSDQPQFTSAMRIKVEGNQRVDIHLPDEVSLFTLNGASSLDDCSEKELSDFASWLGGSYVENMSKPLNGELVIPMVDGACLSLHMSEKADREFATSLVSLINNIRRAKEMHQVLAKSESSPAELVLGRFDGIRALKDHYGKEGIAQSGLEIFFKSISKVFDSLVEAYEGQIVGVIGQGVPSESELEDMFQIKIASGPSARRLQEAKATSNSTAIEEVAFVRKTLAWITGIILLIATLLGIHYLMNMSLTKDTLLYSNVKLD